MTTKPPLKKKRMTRRSFISNAMRAGVVLGVGKGFYNTSSYGIELVERDVKLRALPKGFDGLKVALLSDTHSSITVTKKLLRESALAVMSKKPDLILLGGDYVTGATKFLSTSVGEFNKKHLDKLTAAFSVLKAPMGIYAVLGNHDMWDGEAAARIIVDEFAKKLGAVFLRNESVELKKGLDIKKGNEKITLIGIDDYWSNGSIMNLTKKADKDSVRILLSHNPDINEEIDLLGERIDLVLSGHTHGGQVNVPLLGAPYLPSKFGQKYKAGLVRDGLRQTYITRGVGTLMLPVRFGAPPEVTVLTLRQA